MYKGFSGFSAGENHHSASNPITYEVIGDAVHLDDPSLIRDADMSRDGMDLVLKGAHDTIVVKGYFAAEMTPTLIGPDGASLSPALVESFLKTSPDYAQNHTVSDESPVGSVHEFTGKATVTHADGSVHDIAIGTPIYEGDIIETGDHGAVNINFIDQTNFAVSENARLAIDEYVFDPATNEGTNDFSVLKGVFVFTSGLIGREDPDDVTIKTPVGSIGIRGTIIAGNADSGEITVVEGAIVLHDTHGNEVTLANQFETAKFDAAGGKIEHIGELTAQDVSAKFSSLSSVAGSLFSSIGDAAQDPVETKGDNAPQQEQAPEQKDAQPESKDGNQESHEQTKSDTNSAEAKSEVKGEVQPQAQADKAAQMNNDRLGTMELKLMNGQGSNHDNLLDLKAVTQTVNELKQAMQDRSNQSSDNSKSKSSSASDNNAQDKSDRSDQDNPVVHQDKGNNNTAPINHPVELLSVGYAPTEYFKSTEGKFWTYNFSHEFHDVDGNNTLTYSLASNTVNALNTLQSSVIDTWAFDAQTGILNITFKMVGMNQNIPLNVIASDGETQATFSKTFSYVDTIADLTSSNNSTSTTQVLAENSISSISTNGQNKTVFMKSGIVTDFVVQGDNNKVYIGETENRTVKIDTSADNNIVIGGSKSDHIEIKNANTTIHGLDGDDVVTLHVPSLSSANLSNLVIDLDGGQKSYAHAYAGGQSLTSPGLTYGDALVLKDAGSIDFSNVGDLRGIETILTREPSTLIHQEVTLTYNNVFNMTEGSKTLIFQGDSLDNLNLDASGTKNWSDTTNHVTIGSETYNVWQGTDTSSGQNVTVLVDSDVTVTVV